MTDSRTTDERQSGRADISRRTLLGLLGGTATAAGCRKALPAPLPGEILGNQVPIGHRLGRDVPAATGIPQRRSVVVVGSGVAGLSAVWRLRAAGIDDIEVLELAPTAGGTARSGTNSVGSYPFGAHYLPVPNPETVLVQRLLRDMGLMSGTAQNPRFDPRHLVFAPEDRLFFRGVWYPGLFLSAGASDDDHGQLERFDALTTAYGQRIGADGKRWFTLPTSAASQDPDALALDDISMATWLDRQGITSERVRWTIDYGCRDDYGAGIETVSAWAGIHYFAGRRPMQTPETSGTHYFTWPEGNAHLIGWLKRLVPTLSTGQLVMSADPSGKLTVLDVATETTRELLADHVILATPNHVTERLVPSRRRWAVHAPWLVANLALDRVPASAPEGWNNVLYESPSLGFVNANHQRFGRGEPTNWTWYRALPTAERGLLLASTWTSLSHQVLEDLRPAFGDLRPYLNRLDIWRWGHGTIIPTPGLRRSDARRTAAQPLGQLHFAHTDLGGLPLFEEAQDFGVSAAEAILSAMGLEQASWRTSELPALRGERSLRPAPTLRE